MRVVELASGEESRMSWQPSKRRINVVAHSVVEQIAPHG
jgi:hypothetical protein